MTKNKVWDEAKLDPRKIILDPQNPRIDVPIGATQEQIRLKLLDLEEVLDLARNIHTNTGLFYGERIITTIEDGKHIVLEGNRRVAACQMLLAPSLIPSAYKLRFPALNAATKLKINRVAADVAPTRAAAEPILTKRHTERGAKPWSPVAKMRRAVRLLQGSSVDEVAQILGTSPGQVRKLLKPYRLLKFALALNIWTPDERKRLEDEKLVTNPYTRFFTLPKTLEALQAHFDDEQNLVSGLPAADFKDVMGRIARDFLLPDPANQGKPRHNTRTLPESYFSNVAASPTSAPVVNSPAAKQARNSTSSKPTTPKASVFFENLECHVQDDNLLGLTKEIREINHTKRPIAASMLTRAIFESALIYKLKKEKKWGELIKQLAQENEKNKGKDPGLAAIITYCGVFSNGVFTENNICKTLKSSTTRQAKDYLDAITHLKYQQADAPTLETVANNLRTIIQYILEGN